MDLQQLFGGKENEEDDFLCTQTFLEWIENCGDGTAILKHLKKIYPDMCDTNGNEGEWIFTLDVGEPIYIKVFYMKCAAENENFLISIEYVYADDFLDFMLSKRTKQPF